MKKNLFFHFSVLAMLIVLISACSSKKPEYTNVIPSDASQVIAVNLKSLADKAGTKDKETKEALQKLTDVTLRSRAGCRASQGLSPQPLLISRYSVCPGNILSLLRRNVKKSRTLF